MCPGQFESRRLVMFEKPVLPRSRVVTVVTTFAEAKLMRVVLNVTGDTISTGVMKRSRLMTKYAFQFRVLTD